MRVKMGVKDVNYVSRRMLYSPYVQIHLMLLGQKPNYLPYTHASVINFSLSLTPFFNCSDLRIASAICRILFYLSIASFCIIRNASDSESPSDN